MMRNWQEDWDKIYVTERTSMYMDFYVPALRYWMTKYRELEAESAAIREAVKYLLPYLQRDFPWCENQCRAFRVEQQALSSTAGKALLDRLAKAEAVVEAAKDTCEELWGHGLIAIEALQKALDDLEGGGA